MLRIGVMQGARIIEERIIHTRQSVSVGQSARSTFILAHPSLPAHHVLFESRKTGYVLNARPFMEGRFTTREGVTRLEGDTLRVPLDDSSRGSLVFGDVTLLFQFVVPPPVQPRPQLPSSVRGAWRHEATDLFRPREGFIGLTWLLSFLVCAGFVIFFHVNDWPAEAQAFDIDNKWIDFVIQTPEDLLEAQAREASRDSSVEGEGEAEQDEAKRQEAPRKDKVVKKGPRKPLTEEQKRADEAKRQAQIRALVENSGLALVLGSKSGDASGNAGADLLTGSGPATDIDKLMSQVGTLKQASAADAWSKLDDPAVSDSGKVVALEDLRAAQADAEVISSDAKEKAPKAKAKLGPLEEQLSPGILDEKKVIATVRKGMPAIRNCYEKGLNKNHGLQGKINVEFTIGTSGRVTSVKAKGDSLGDPAVTSCVLGKFKSFTFDKPAGGSVKYLYPLMFKPGG
ncbi:MAG: AgmX/PglI C-terminal domain-containing protein [Deltaproteobacteria bacterium]|nr:AgmX/PglI C-terminal domain-containing protein [Deltaproteobacteria bacterium]